MARLVQEAGTITLYTRGEQKRISKHTTHQTLRWLGHPVSQEHWTEAHQNRQFETAQSPLLEYESAEPVIQCPFPKLAHRLQPCHHGI